jgi:hypothetical protein
MALTFSKDRRSRLESRKRARAEYKMIFALSFPFFLIGALFARPADYVRLPFFAKRKPTKSLMTDARDSANCVLPYAFMG